VDPSALLTRFCPASIVPALRGSISFVQARRLARVKAAEASHPPPAGELHTSIAWPLKLPIYVIHAPELEVRRMAGQTKEWTSTFKLTIIQILRFVGIKMFGIFGVILDLLVNFGDFGVILRLEQP